MRRYDDENAYPLWCRVAGHRWWRPFYPADYDSSWQRDGSCHRCEHILRGPAKVAARWRRINAEAKAAGCQCGQAATNVRYYGPAAIWSCEEHEGVNQWRKSADGSWIPELPTPEETEALARWETAGPRPYTDVDKIRKGTS